MTFDVEQTKALAARLEPLKPPAEPGNDDPPEWNLAYDLAEAEESCRAYLERISKLRASEGEALAAEAFHELREEVRHLLYHLATPAFKDLSPDR